MSFLLVLVPLALMFMCQSDVHGKAINSLIGPYIAYVEHIFNCEPNLPSPWYLRASHFNPRKPKELQVLKGNVTLSNSFDDSIWIKVVVDVRSNNQWKENAFVFNFKNNGCRAFKENIPEIFNRVFKRGEVDGVYCHVKPGLYEANNTPAAWTFPNVPIIPYGHYRYRSWFGKPWPEKHACWAVEGHVIPKPG